MAVHETVHAGAAGAAAQAGGKAAAAAAGAGVETSAAVAAAMAEHTGRVLAAGGATAAAGAAHDGATAVPRAIAGQAAGATAGADHVIVVGLGAGGIALAHTPEIGGVVGRGAAAAEALCGVVVQGHGQGLVTTAGAEAVTEAGIGIGQAEDPGLAVGHVIGALAGTRTTAAEAVKAYRAANAQGLLMMQGVSK